MSDTDVNKTWNILRLCILDIQHLTLQFSTLKPKDRKQLTKQQTYGNIFGKNALQDFHSLEIKASFKTAKTNIPSIIFLKSGIVYEYVFWNCLR